MLSIIIVNYKTPQLTLRCVKSIVDTMVSPYEIIVVDNHSQDDSESLLCSRYPQILWINNPENSGFGRGNNLGAQSASGEVLLLLNSDMILKENTVESCLEILKTDERIGVLGCTLRNEDGSLQKSVYHFVGEYWSVLKNNILIDYFSTPKTPKIGAIMGAFMLIPKHVFDNVNGFDPDFFMYAEELEMCRRIRGKGFSIEFTTQVEAIHKHGGSSENSNWSSRQNYLSNALLFLKVKGLGGYFVYHFICQFNFITNLAVLWKMDKSFRKNFWKETSYYFSNFSSYIRIPFAYSKKYNSGKTYLRKY